MPTAIQLAELEVTQPLRVTGFLQGLALRADGLPRRERLRVQSSDELLVLALKRRGAIPEEYRDRAFAYRAQPNVIQNAGINYLNTCWQGSTEPEIMKYHANGVGAANGSSATQTALGSECTSASYADAQGNARIAGTTVQGGATNVFRTVGTNVFKGSQLSITEWGLLNQAALAGGVIFSRVVFSVITINATDSIQWTYECTIGTLG